MTSPSKNDFINRIVSKNQPSQLNQPQIRTHTPSHRRIVIRGTSVEAQPQVTFGSNYQVKTLMRPSDNLHIP